ncbi:MAG: GMP synthase [Calditrichaeota bacterium]|nr:MAG: GMP synthase [Calditrichota bacterium]MBL1205642.1 GMP synthase [Calditrichota bacterium]NOG45470.1 GMP synthase [Calditrichota bacterium]
MNICLLKCGNVQPDLLPISGDHEDMFIALFKKYSPSIHLSVFDVQKNIYPENLNAFDGFLSTGSPDSVYADFEWIETYKKFVHTLYIGRHKHVGICFGHQMIAEALGGKVEKSKQNWGIGIKTMQIKSSPNWMNKNKTYRLIVSHQDQVIQLPEKAQVIAGNDHCPVGIFTVDNHVLAIQQHPEFTKEYHAASIKSRKKIIKPELIESALKSLDQETDSSIVAKWIENFFKS